MSDNEKALRSPMDHVNVFARRNGFTALYDAKFDRRCLRFSASLRVGDQVFSKLAKRKSTAKQLAAFSFLRFLSSSKTRTQWGLPEEEAECEEYLNRIFESLNPNYFDDNDDDTGSTSKGERLVRDAPRSGNIMELKRICHMRSIKCQVSHHQEGNGTFRATVKLGNGRKFEATGSSGRKARAAVCFAALNYINGPAVANETSVI